MNSYIANVIQTIYRIRLIQTGIKGSLKGEIIFKCTCDFDSRYYTLIVFQTYILLSETPAPNNCSNNYYGVKN